jgi:large repetitive protein
VATVSLNVNPVNDPPTVVNDSYTLTSGATQTVAAPGVLANDSDPEGDALTVVSAPNAFVVINPNGSFT